MSLKLLDAEQLRTQQLSILVFTQRMPYACRKSELFDIYYMLLIQTRVNQRPRPFNLRLSKTHTTLKTRTVVPDFCRLHVNAYDYLSRYVENKNYRLI